MKTILFVPPSTVVGFAVGVATGLLVATFRDAPPVPDQIDRAESITVVSPDQPVIELSPTGYVDQGGRADGDRSPEQWQVLFRRADGTGVSVFADRVR